MPMILYGPWRSTVAKLTAMTAKSAVAADRAIRDEAMLFMREVVKSFRTQQEGSWKPISPITRAMRKGMGKIGKPTVGGTKALVATGGLRKSVKLHQQAPLHYFVGVHRTAGKNRRGMKYANVAAVHETGTTVIPITRKMRGYFMYLFWKGVIPFPWPPPSKNYIVIPQRSFLRATFKKAKQGHVARLHKRYATYIMTGKALKL